MAGYLGSVPVPQATQHRESFTCTEGQTSFATAGYTAQFVDVYLNGSHLSPADFTATNGSDVVLGVAASADDVCDIISYTPFEIADQTFTGTTIMTNGDNTAQLTLTSTDADANAGPNLRLYRNSGSPADGDNIGQINFEGRNDNSQDVVYANILSRLRDNTDGTEDGGIEINVMKDGSLTGLWKYYSSGTTSSLTFNDDSIDMDFVVESNGNANMLFVDGGNNKIGINNGSPARQLHVTDTIANSGASLGLTSSDSSTTGSMGIIHFGNNTDSSLASIGAIADGATDAGALLFKTEATGEAISERFRISSDGSLSTPTLGTSNVRFGVNAGNSIASGGNYNVCVGDEAGTAITTGDDNTFLGFRAGDLNSTGSDHTMVGYRAGSTTATSGSTIPMGNTFIGRFAGHANTTGSGNVYIGYRANGEYGAGHLMTTGSKNTILGGYNGNQGGLDIRTASNNIVLSDGDGNPRATCFSAGSWNFYNTGGSGSDNVNARNGDGAGTGRSLYVGWHSSTSLTTGTLAFNVTTNGNVTNINNSYGAISDVKLKENIVDATSQWDDIKALTVRKYSMKADSLDAPNMLGVVAQELEAAGMGGLVTESPDKNPDGTVLDTTTKSVNYSILYMKAVKALQEAMTRIEALETKVTALEGA